ncbi:MAG: DUF928 domain-containing protein [Synechococcales bacterium]|nr:DUF928 domain-containing protein [Synechococcales bacterium]
MRYAGLPFLSVASSSLSSLDSSSSNLLNATSQMVAGLAIALTLTGTIAPAASAQGTDGGDRGQSGTLAPTANPAFPEFTTTGQSDGRVGGASRAFPDFRSTGQSGNRVGGASRGGSCVQLAEEPLTPLAPVEAGYGGRTTQAHPTVWVYVPYLLTAESPITFSLLDGAGDTIYQSTFTTEMESGIVGLTLPPSVTLQEGETYDWYFLVYCNDPQRRDVPAFASGWIERVPLTGEMTAEQLAAMPVSDRSNFYARELLWYDALNTLGEALRSNPNDPQLLETWNWLLQLPSVKLEEFGDAEISPCCRMEEYGVTLSR